MDKKYYGPMRFAHRGVAQAAPENTLGAFQAAADLGLEGIELDIRLSRDGEIVIVHDDNLTRHTLGHPTKFSNGLIAEMSWEELSKIELPYANHLLDIDPPYSAKNEFMALMPNRQMGQETGHSYQKMLEQEPRMASLMLLSDFIEWFEKAPKKMMVEIEVNAQNAVEKIFRLLDTSSAKERCIVFSGNPSFIGEIQMTAAMQGKPEGVKLGANIVTLNEDNMEEIEDMDLFEVGINAGCITPEKIAWLKERNIKVFSNLGDYPEWWTQLNELKVDAFKTNYAEGYTNWWNK